MDVAIVVLNWNGQELLEKLLPVLIKNSPEAVIYVADNASTDDSLKTLRENFTSVKIIEIPENLGFSGGYNYALKRVPEDLFVLLNSDVEVTENWLSPLLDHFKQNPKTAVAQPKIKDYYNRDYFEYAGAAGGFIDNLGFPYCRGRIFDTIEKDEGQYDDTCKIFWASGACLLIRKSVYHKVGGLDETYFAHQEEIDLSWRVQLAGYTVKYIGESSVFHMGGATLSAMNTTKTFLNFRNSLFNLLKNKSQSTVFFSILGRLILDGGAFFYFVLKAKFNHSWAIIRAHFSFYRHLPEMLQKRRKIKQKFRLSSGVKSIVWLYFCRSQKQYRQLERR